MKPLRWGVLGVSEMVGRLAVLPALQRSPTAELVAVASRNAARAELEAVRFGAHRWYADYAALLHDPDVEAVYIPLPNALHLPWTELAAAAGKHVLCEKPLACTADEARLMAAVCERAGVVLMEAYMSPFHQRNRRIADLVAGGELGRVISGRSVFTFPNRDPQNHRWLAHGGGSLLDVGIYCLAPLCAVAGSTTPQRVAASAEWTPDGVDVSFSGWLDFGGGFTASFATSFDAPEQQSLDLMGTEATLFVDRPFTAGIVDSDLLLRSRTGDTELLTISGNDSYLAMVEHFARVVRGEEPQQPTVADSIALLSLLDRLREAAQASR